MAEQETTRTLPPKWSDDNLSEHIETAFSNALATFVNKKPEYGLFVGIDEVYISACQDFKINPPDLMSALFLVRAHSGYRAATQLAMNGQIAESFPVLRVCLEYSLYALHINKSPAVEGEPDLGRVWIQRHDDPAAKQASRNNFGTGRVFATLRECDRGLGESIGGLYERTIDFGGHPNERAVTGSMTMTDDDGRTEIQPIYLHGDSIHLDHALKTTAQVGLGCLFIFRHIFQERFEILGISADIEILGKVL